VYCWWPYPLTHRTRRPEDHWTTGPHGVHVTCWPLLSPLYHPWMIDECKAFGGVRNGRGRRSNWGKTRRTDISPLPPTQIPLGMIWARSRSTGVGNRLLTVLTMAWPTNELHRAKCFLGSNGCPLAQGNPSILIVVFVVLVCKV
jgi:hypothetical protein